MKLGVMLPKYYRPGQAHPYSATYDLALRAEDAGFEVAGVPHHSFTPDTEDYAAPLLMLAALAARTTTLRLLSSIFILPLHQPAAVAEQVAELDRICNGRFIFGVAGGYRDYEFAGHGIDMKSRAKRMDEMLQIIRQGMTTGDLAFKGRFFDIPSVPLAPSPVQRPHPPMWVGGTADAALRRAARYADGWLSENLFMLDDICERMAAYRRFSDECGRRHGTVAVIRNASIAPRRDSIEANWLPGVVSYHLFNRANYRKAGMEMPDPDGLYARLESGGSTTLHEFSQGRVIAGTPDDCIDQILTWERASGCDYLYLSSRPYMTSEAEYEEQKAFFDLFGKEVIPALKASSARSDEAAPS